MIRNFENAPDWSNLEFGEGRFQVVHDLLDEYERQSKDTHAQIDRDIFLNQCVSVSEREAMTREMDYLDELASDPITFIGQYLIEKPVGVGGFGVVSLAYSPDGTPVAVKVPHMSWQLAKTKEELEFESKILNELAHPNIVEFIEFGYDQNWFMVTEWINGLNLGKAIEEVSAPIEHWIQIILQVCDALSFGHRLGIVHRDIKPKNIMVHGKGTPTVKVLDYGIAKRVSCDHATTEHIKGTGEFVAPEQYQGKCDKGSDIYSLGVTLAKILESQQASKKSKALDGVVRKATRKNPKQRYQSIDEMRSDIETVDQGGFIRPDRRLLGGNAFALAGLLVLLASCFLFFNGAGHGFSNKNAESIRLSGNVSENSKGDSVASKDAYRFQHNVRLKTIPEGASLTAYLLNQGEPLANSKIELGVSPCDTRLEPGDFLIVATWSDGQFSEVLRRIPEPDLVRPPSFSTFDAFRELEDGTVFVAPIRLRTANKSNMLLVDGLWVEIDARKELEQPPVGSTFAMICGQLEREGKRLALHSELELIRQFGVVDFSQPEWTSTIVLRSDFSFPGKTGVSRSMVYSGLKTFMPDSDGDLPRFISENDKSGELSFRGVRSDLPFEIGD